MLRRGRRKVERGEGIEKVAGKGGCGEEFGGRMGRKKVRGSGRKGRMGED